MCAEIKLLNGQRLLILIKSFCKIHLARNIQAEEDEELANTLHEVVSPPLLHYYFCQSPSYRM